MGKTKEVGHLPTECTNVRKKNSEEDRGSFDRDFRMKRIGAREKWAEESADRIHMIYKERY